MTAAHGRAAVLAVVFDPKRNSLNAIRLFLAIVVIFSHTWPIGGYGEDPGVRGSTLGTWAVYGFFAISGYLITASRFSSRHLGDFLWRRTLRIYPAFWAALLLVALIAAPATSGAFSTAWRPIESVTYFLRNLSLFILQPTVGATLTVAPYPFAWNGSAWTLKYEFGCYLMIGLVVTLMRSRRGTFWAMTIILAATEIALVYYTWKHGGGEISRGYGPVLQLVPVFAAGGLLYLLRDRVSMQGWLAGVAAAMCIASAAFGAFPVIAPVPSAYLMLWLGAKLPFQRVASRNDVSYGMYIYAFPMQQLLALALAGRGVPPILFALLSVLVTAPLAWASWLWIERPAMRLKRLTAGRMPDTEGHVLTVGRGQSDSPNSSQ